MLSTIWVALITLFGPSAWEETKVTRQSDQDDNNTCDLGIKNGVTTLSETERGEISFANL